MLNRREALGVIGAALASPTLFVKEINAKKIIRTDQQIISTGFPILDAALDGGLRRQSINTIYGRPGSGKTVFSKSIGLNAAKTHSVAILAENPHNFLTKKLDPRYERFEGSLTYYDGYKNHNIKDLMESHDVIIWETFNDHIIRKALDISPPFQKYINTKTYAGFKSKIANAECRKLHGMANDYNTCLIVHHQNMRGHWSSSAVIDYNTNTIKGKTDEWFAPAGLDLFQKSIALDYYSHVMLKMESSYYSGYRGTEGSINYTTKITKNRWGVPGTRHQFALNENMTFTEVGATNC